MKVAALISGGKDSCYNMMQCQAAGHELVALATITPYSKTEIDSYMYQSVGYEAIDLIAQAMKLPLFRQETKGASLLKDLNYVPTDTDEVEDLTVLLQQVQSKLKFDAVSIGAILSDYQRIRVENVCLRLGLVPLSYLWQRNQHELLKEIINCEVDAIIIKVAALGLQPSRHLGLSLKSFESHLHLMHDKYGLNVCGEGGEYESLVLDCPLYSSRLIIQESEVILHTNDPIAPVGYLKLNKLKLEPKAQPLDLKARFNSPALKDSDGYITEHSEDAEDFFTNEAADDVTDNTCTKINFWECEQRVSYGTSKNGWLWVGGITGQDEDCGKAFFQALEKLKSILEQHNHTLKDICSVSLYISDMSNFAHLNRTYIEILNHINPPTRACVEIPSRTPVLLEVVSWAPVPLPSGDLEVNRYTLHVQSISHWAPANIGPYSQAVKIGELIYLAGVIGLVPGSMELVRGGIKHQCQLALRHINRILNVVDATVDLRNVVQAVCYLTHINNVETARKLWETETKNAIVNYVVVSALPKNALVEWHVWAHKHNNTFEYEETGKCVDDWSISIYRRWNFENDIASIICIIDNFKHSGDLMSMEACKHILQYVLEKVQQGEELSVKSVCNLRIHYVPNNMISISTIIEVLDYLKEMHTIVYTLVPVISLHTRHSCISISGIRM